jgi:hypothetical protein
VNLARGGATVDDLVGQAQEAVALKPKNPLVAIPIMDNDIVCPATYAKALAPAQRVSAGDTRPCAFINPREHLVLQEPARLDGIIHQYEAHLKAGCLKVTRCRYDKVSPAGVTSCGPSR